MKLLPFVLLSVVSSLSAVGEELTVGTFNLRYDNPADVERGNGWKQRAPVISQLIKFHKFDIVCTQEGFLHQMKDVEDALGDGFGCVKFGRDDGAEEGEMVGLIFEKKRLQVVSKGRFWLSKTPNEANEGWDAVLPRMCTWAEFTDAKTKKNFYVFGFHFDHRGKVARVESAKLMRVKAVEITGDAPVIFMGDLNASEKSEPWKAFADGEAFADAHDLAESPYVLTGSFSRFNPNYDAPYRIDHIFLPATAKVSRYGVLTDSYRSKTDGVPEARLPSDHFPVLATFKF